MITLQVSLAAWNLLQDGWLRMKALERVDALETWVSIHAEDATDALPLLDDCIPYSLIEFGGFVTSQMRFSLPLRGLKCSYKNVNFVLWNHRQDHIDTSGENCDGETTTDDEGLSTADAVNLLDAMRREQNATAANERWNDSSQIQRAIMVIMVLLDASSGAWPFGNDNGGCENNRKFVPMIVQKCWTQRCRCVWLGVMPK
jgi:hypothetical protein